MNQEFSKLDRCDGQNYTRWADKVNFMLHVLKLAYVLDPKLALIHADPIPEAGKTVDPTIISDLEKQRDLYKKSEELYVGHIKNSLSDRLYDLRAGPVAHAVEQVTDMVESVDLGEIFMISSLAREICARGCDEGSASRPSVERNGASVSVARNTSTKSLTHSMKRMESNMRELHYILPNRMVWLKERIKPFVRWSTVCIVVESKDMEFFEDKFYRDDENSSHTTLTNTSREILSPPPIVEEPMRITRARIAKSVGDGFYSYLVEGTQKKVTREVIFAINLNDDPKTFTEAMTSTYAPLWKEAINDEMDSIMGNGTWELADLPKGRRSI
uniref:Uncharacterized protein n=1 Tax=Lactuca sativa TaxID=4236 RepID=A0A9R1X7I4_LACSA|nr:hypothetical protein LSAT_V11C600311460 [Lactuca sativa]